MKLTLGEELEDAQMKAETIKDRFLRNASTIEDEMIALETESKTGRVPPENQLEYDAFDKTHTATESIGDDADELYDEIVEAIESLDEFYELIERLRNLEKEVTAYQDDTDHSAVRDKLVNLLRV